MTEETITLDGKTYRLDHRIKPTKKADIEAARVEAEITRLRAENARLRAELDRKS